MGRPALFSFVVLLAKWSILIATVIATVVSFFATTQGLTRYLAYWLAWPLALAVQLALFGLAWLVGLDRSPGRAVAALLYSVVMLFSVTFSYVFFQSEFTAILRPAVRTRELTDQIDHEIRRLGAQTAESLATARQAKAQLDSWLEIENSVGFSTRSCIDEPIRYLSEICRRLRERVNAWEQSTGQRYREGPGEKLIYSSLQAETTTVQADVQDLEAFSTELSKRSYRTAGLLLAERIGQYEATVTKIPAIALPRYLSKPVEISRTFSVAEFARLGGAARGAFCSAPRYRSSLNPS
jgi:hypothetical protein